MRVFSLLFGLLLTFAAIGQKGATISVNVQLDNCSSLDSVVLYQFDGLQYKVVSTTKSTTDGNFSLNVPGSATPQFYYVGVNVEESPRCKTIIVGNEKKISIKGPCFDIRKATIGDSKLNQEFEYATTRNNTLKVEMGNIINEYRTVYNDEAKRKEVEKKMGEVDRKKIAFLDSLRKSSPFVANVVALDTYISYQNSPDAKKYADEINYFINEYFHYADFSNPVYNDIPFVFDMFKSWTDVIGMVGVPAEQQIPVFDAILARIPAGSNAYKLAMGGIITSLIANNQGEAFVKMGDRYGSLYGTSDPANASRVMQQVNRFRQNLLGVPAPDFVMNDLNGNPVSLSAATKGKVVLVDFWASWCGPCRRENPNVVNMYNKYKDKGFDVFSVSLDKTQEPWAKAIEADGLIWKNHVSDLKGWQNSAAQLYGITSIPHTLLLDREGRIIARQLRGQALEQKLKEIFGE